MHFLHLIYTQYSLMMDTSPQCKTNKTLLGVCKKDLKDSQTVRNMTLSSDGFCQAALP